MNKVLFAALNILICTSCVKSGFQPPPIPPDYRSWKSSHDGFLKYPIPGHMDNYRKIYFNDKASNVGPGEDYPDGTVIIKEIYKQNSTERPFQLTVMIKDHASPQAVGGWVWVVKNDDDPVEHVITGEFCFTCHTDANVSQPYGDGNPDKQFRDYVFIPLFAKQLTTD